MFVISLTPKNIDRIDKILSEIFNEDNKECTTKEKPFKMDTSLASEVIASLESKGITYEIFSRLLEVNKISTLSLILKEAAIILDKKYKDNHIKDCKDVWIIDYQTKKLEEIFNLKDLYKIYPLFRTEEDAYRARSLVKDLLDMI